MEVKLYVKEDSDIKVEQYYYKLVDFEMQEMQVDESDGQAEKDCTYAESD